MHEEAAPIWQTQVLPEAQAAKPALDLLRDGEIVAIPTETVYGLAGDAANGAAVAKIFEAKGRPSFNPLILHVSDLAMAETVGVFDPLSRQLAAAFWPGPLTLVLPLAEGAAVHPLALAGLQTVALRQPRGFAAGLIGELGGPLAAPSANVSGRLSPTSAAAVQAALNGRIPLVVDGGPAPVGVESTIVRVSGGELHLLRPGGVTAAELEAAAGAPLIRPEAGARIEAPGMMFSHYAPNAPLRLAAERVEQEEALLAFGPARVAGAEKASVELNLSPSGSLREAAANLFSFLRQLDERKPDGIAVMPIPSDGLGEAINDRLRRAAAPRGQG